ncbi:MAG TPA: M28 family peptidase [Bdellovibrionales bacterium]|nr:M28 family peptidase [Bdellovibrionales bacterium]
MVSSRTNEALRAAAVAALTFVAANATALTTPSAPAVTPVLADVDSLRKIGAEVLATHEETNVGYAKLSQTQQEALSALNHEAGRCGGFEALPYSADLEPMSPVLTHVFGQLSERELKNRQFENSSQFMSMVEPKSEIQKAVDDVSEDNLRATVQFMSSYNDRTYNGASPNTAVDALKTRIEETVKNSPLGVTVEFVNHTGIRQKSIRARIEGSTRPNEIVVMGGHLDSINQSWMGDKRAPGADDNASGSSNILEALRIISQQARPERTIEFFWYAGEEGGLLGSAEIARTYKAEKKDVVAVLQLDMTLFPGDGEFTLGSMTDFTSAWLRSYVENINGIYTKARIVNDKCGYGCSDHASWNRQGYPAVMPFEATFNGMNHNLHTAKDVIDANSNFRHSAMFSKLAIAMALDLGNSTLREQ